MSRIEQQNAAKSGRVLLPSEIDKTIEFGENIMNLVRETVRKVVPDLPDEKIYCVADGVRRGATKIHLREMHRIELQFVKHQNDRRLIFPLQWIDSEHKTPSK